MDPLPLIIFILVVISVIFLVIVPVSLPLPKWCVEKCRKNSYVVVGFERIPLDYSLPPLLGVLILLASTSLTFNEDVKNGIVGDDHVKPYSILILFMSLAYVCISLDLTGFFAYLALKIAAAAGSSGRKLFIYYFTLASLMTIFTSNDIVILTLTPIICYFTKVTNTDPIPFLFSEFLAANLWSMILYVGNPTNIIVADAYSLSFIGYSRWMALPSIAAGIVLLASLFIMFGARIPKTFVVPAQINPKAYLKDLKGAIFGCVNLGCCLICLSISQFLSVPMWAITLGFAGAFFIRNILAYVFGILGPDTVETQLNRVTDTDSLINASDYAQEEEETFSTGPETLTIWSAFKLMPWKVIPFALGMFILVEGLTSSGWIDWLASGIASSATGAFSSVFLMGGLSILLANMINNQPMTILLTRVLLSKSFDVTGTARTGAMFALILGSNLGACFTLIGALAGIMWANLLVGKGIVISYLDFLKVGLKIMFPVVTLSLLTIALESYYWDPVSL